MHVFAHAYVCQFIIIVRKKVRFLHYTIYPLAICINGKTIKAVYWLSKTTLQFLSQSCSWTWPPWQWCCRGIHGRTTAARCSWHQSAAHPSVRAQSARPPHCWTRPTSRRRQGSWTPAVACPGQRSRYLGLGWPHSSSLEGSHRVSATWRGCLAPAKNHWNWWSHLMDEITDTLYSRREVIWNCQRAIPSANLKRTTVNNKKPNNSGKPKSLIMSVNQPIFKSNLTVIKIHKRFMYCDFPHLNFYKYAFFFKNMQMINLIKYALTL